MTTSARQRVLEFILDHIRSNKLPAGSVTPTSRVIIDSVDGATPASVTRASRELQDAGIVRAFRGKGTFLLLDWNDVPQQWEQYLQRHATQGVMDISEMRRRTDKDRLIAEVKMLKETVRRLEALLQTL